MSLAPMTRITILAPKTSQASLLDLLQRLSIIEVTDLIEADLSPLNGGLTREMAAQIQHLTSNLKNTQSAIKILKEEFRPSQSIIDQFASTRLPVSEDLFSHVYEDSDSVLELCNQVKELENRLSELDKLQTKCQQDLDSLKPWFNLDIPLSELQGTETSEVKLGVLERPAYQELLSEIENSGDSIPPLYIEVVEDKGLEIFLFVIFLKANQSQVWGLLNRYNFTEVTLPSNYGAVSEAYKELQRDVDSIQKQSEDLREQLAQLNQDVAKLYTLSDVLNLELQKLSVAEKFGGTGHVVVTNGWCRSSDYKNIKEAVETAIPTAVVESREPIEGELPPVDFENPKLIKPYETITTTAGIPKQGSPDPTPALAPFFFMFFGIALGDAGYGVILTLLAIWLLKRTRAVGDGRNFLIVLTMGGLSTFSFGVITGSWFGDLLPIEPIWFNPIDNPIQMLIVSLILGLVHLYVGLGVTFLHNVRQGKIWDALFDQGLWWVFITGLALVLIGAGEPAKYTAIAGALGLVLTQGRKEKSLLKKVFKGVSSLLGVSDYLSDVLSYSRLLALGLATSVIGVVINDVSVMVKDIPVLGIFFVALILIFGHLFNLLINVVSAYVHTSRLQYVEFFSKCFEGGGRLFKPFAFRTKMVQIVTEKDESISRKVKGGTSKWKLHGDQH